MGAKTGAQTVPVRGAGRTLEALWDTLGAESRASTGNLIALVSPAHLSRVGEALAGLQGRYAGRQIICVLDESAPLGRVDVQVSLVPQAGGLHVERLVLAARADEILGAVLPLLRPATLNYVWWGADIAPPPEVLRGLLDIADKVICDSLGLGICPGKHYALADLGWARLSHWREALAQTFDRRNAATTLPTLTQMQLTYAGNNPLPAWLYAGWVADTLGWPDLSSVTVTAGICERRSGDLCRVELSGGERAGTKDRGARFVLEGGEGNTMHIRGTWADSEGANHTLEQQLHLPPLSLTAGLADLLRDPRPQPSFERAWALAEAMQPRL